MLYLKRSSPLPIQRAAKTKTEEGSNEIDVLATEHRLEAHLVLPTAKRIIIGNGELSPLVFVQQR